MCNQEDEMDEELAMSEQGLPADLPITIDRDVMSGAPVFRGTRVPVQTVFDYVADGYTLDDFLDNFPTVRREDAVRILEAAGRYLAAGAIQR